MYFCLMAVYLNSALFNSINIIESIYPNVVTISPKQFIIASTQTQYPELNEIKLLKLYAPSLSDRVVFISSTNQAQSPGTSQPTATPSNQAQSPGTSQPTATPSNQPPTSTSQTVTSTPNQVQSPNTNQSVTSTPNQPPSSNTIQSPYSTIYPALITAGGAILIGILTFLYNRASLAESKRKERRESITKKLNEFYGPLNSYLKITLEFNRIVKTGKPLGFRTLVHLIDDKYYRDDKELPITLLDSDKKIIAEIIDIEKKIEELVTSKGGLIDDPEQADLLAKAIAHFRVLRLAFSGEIGGEVERFKTFAYPQELDNAVQSRINALQEELRKISTPGWIENLLKL